MIAKYIFAPLLTVLRMFGIFAFEADGLQVVSGNFIRDLKMYKISGKTWITIVVTSDS